MGTILVWVLVAICLCFGFLGCFVNKVPGPIAVLLAMLIAMFGLDIDLGWDKVAIVAALTVASIVLSKILVKAAKKMYEFSKRGSWGTTIGSLLGLGGLMGASGSDSTAVLILLFVICLVGLPFVFAFLFELTNKKGVQVAVKSASSATCAYLADTLLKLVVFVYAIYAIFQL